MTVVQFAFYFGTARAERASENSNLLLAMLAVILALPLDRVACRFSGGSHISEFFTRARAVSFLPSCLNVTRIRIVPPNSLTRSSFHLLQLAGECASHSLRERLGTWFLLTALRVRPAV